MPAFFRRGWETHGNKSLVANAMAEFRSTYLPNAVLSLIAAKIILISVYDRNKERLLYFRKKLNIKF
jgi:hypothetical protein